MSEKLSKAEQELSDILRQQITEETWREALEGVAELQVEAYKRWCKEHNFIE